MFHLIQLLSCTAFWRGSGSVHPTELFNCEQKIHQRERGKDSVAGKHNALSLEGIRSPALTQVAAVWKTCPQNKDQNFSPCTVAHSYAACTVLSAVSFRHSTSSIIKEDPLYWKGLYKYPFHHNISKHEFHCIARIYDHSESKPYSIT